MGKHERPRGPVKTARQPDEPAPETPREPTPTPPAPPEVMKAAEEQIRGRLVYIQALWQERLGLLASKALVSPAEFLEGLIRRAWVSSGAGKGQP